MEKVYNLKNVSEFCKNTLSYIILIIKKHRKNFLLVCKKKRKN